MPNSDSTRLRPVDPGGAPKMLCTKSGWSSSSITTLPAEDLLVEARGAVEVLDAQRDVVVGVPWHVRFLSVGWRLDVIPAARSSHHGWLFYRTDGRFPAREDRRLRQGGSGRHGQPDRSRRRCGSTVPARPALNEFDLNAVEEALRLKEAAGGAEVVVVSMGPERTLESLRKTLAMGADRVVLVADAAAEGRRPRRHLARSRGRARARVARISSSSDSRHPTPTEPSCGRPSRSASSCRSPRRPPSSTLADGTVSVKRQTEYGYDRIEAPLPAVVAVSDAINEPRYPSLKGIMGAKSKPQDVVSLADLGVERGARRPLCSTSTRRRRAATRGRSTTTGRPPSSSSPSCRSGSCCEDARLPRAPRPRS